MIAAYFLDFIGGIELAMWFFAGLFITGIFLKRINLLSSSVSKVQDTFHQYHQLLDLIETTDFSVRNFAAEKEQISSEKQKASKILHEFSKAIDALDQRNNMIFGMLGNGFLLWDLRQSYRLEKWIKEHGQDVEKWFRVIEFLDAYNSLGNFAFNHPAYVFPQIESRQAYYPSQSTGTPSAGSRKEDCQRLLPLKKSNFSSLPVRIWPGKAPF